MECEIEHGPAQRRDGLHAARVAPAPGRQRVIFHVDLDCFFAAVATRAAIEARAAASIQATTGLTLEPGVALFDRSRQLWAVGPRGQSWFAEAAF